jgi:hypothetical protein
LAGLDSSGKNLRAIAIMSVSEMKPIRVTFDSNVWERVVFPDNDSDPNHILLLRLIKEALQDGRLQGFICESLGTLEAIKKEKRQAYFANKKPKSDVQIKGSYPKSVIAVEVP